MRLRAAAALGLVALATAACGATSAPAPPPLRVAVRTSGLVDDVATGLPVARDRVLTVAHVLDGAQRVEVAGRRARVLRADRALDLALLAVRGVGGPPLRLAEDRADGRLWVLRDGRARALAAHVRRRALATVRGPDGVPTARHRPVLELAAAVAPGDSGAALTDASGRLLGIVFARSGTRPGVAWAVDARAVEGMLRTHGPEGHASASSPHGPEGHAPASSPSGSPGSRAS